jgi:hypothetical protein
MYKEPRSEDSEGIVGLIKETADGFSHLIADHVKLARLELVADLKIQGRRIAVVALVVPFIFLGYGLACLGLSFLLSRWLGPAGALFAVGGVHAVGGTIGAVVSLAKLRKVDLMHETSIEVNRSVNTLARVSNGAASPSVREPLRDGLVPRGSAARTPRG